MDAQPLQVGDRVRTVRQIDALPEGACGTVERVFTDAILYDVCFDAPYDLRLVLASELAPIEQTREVGAA